MSLVCGKHALVKQVEVLPHSIEILSSRINSEFQARPSQTQQHTKIQVGEGKSWWEREIPLRRRVVNLKTCVVKAKN